MERTRKKKSNIFVRYFTPFGLKQVCDFTMVIGFILLIVGLCTVEGVLLAGFITYAVGSAMSMGLCIKTLVKVTNKRDPERKSAIVNVSIISVLFALALFGIIWTCVA